MDREDYIIIGILILLIVMIYITVNNIIEINNEIKRIRQPDKIDCDIHDICEVIEELNNVTDMDAIL